MANYYAAARTNYFKIDPAKREAFLAWIEKFKLEYIEDKENQFTLFPGGWTDDGTFPSYDPALEDKDGEDPNFVFTDELFKFLAPGSVAIMIESGHEKLRYVGGHAIAIDHTGKEVCIALHQIYDLAKAEFPGAEVTQASY
jgi:hypothetical protein